jgi:hypothetical protein
MVGESPQSDAMLREVGAASWRACCTVEPREDQRDSVMPVSYVTGEMEDDEPVARRPL